MRKVNELALYKAALRVACELLNGDVVYGIDAERLFNKIMNTDGNVCSLDYESFILKNIWRFSDNDKERAEAIKKLGW